MKAFRLGAQACILATWFLISLTPVQAAVVVLPDAAYQAELNYPPPPRRLFTAGGIGVDEDWLTGSGTRRGHVTASAGTVGGLMPRAEISIDLTAQELLAPPTFSSMVEVEDICDVDPLLRTGSFVANELRADVTDDSIEIELTPEQIDALLDGRPIP